MFRGSVCVANSQLCRGWGLAPLGRLHCFTPPQTKYYVSRRLYNSIIILVRLTRFVCHSYTIPYNGRSVHLLQRICFGNTNSMRGFKWEMAVQPNRITDLLFPSDVNPTLRIAGKKKSFIFIRQEIYYGWCSCRFRVSSEIERKTLLASIRTFCVWLLRCKLRGTLTRAHPRLVCSAVHQQLLILGHWRTPPTCAAHIRIRLKKSVTNSQYNVF